MILGRIIGEVWATQKHERLEGAKAMLVARLRRDGARLVPTGEVVVALDDIGAQTGHIVTVSWGSGARAVFAPPDNRNVLVDAAISRIVDGYSVDEAGAGIDVEHTE